MDPIELQLQQQISAMQQQPEPPMPPISIPNPTVPEPNVPNPVVTGIKDLVFKNFKPRDTFINYVANKALGGRGAAIFGAGMGILPFAAPMIQRAASAIGGALQPNPQQQGIAAYINQVYGTTPTGQISTGPMAGYNTISGLGSPGAIDSAISRIGRIASSRRKRESGALEQRQKDLQKHLIQNNTRCLKSLKVRQQS